MALMCWATHVLQWYLQWDAKRQLLANPQRIPQFGLYSATRVHEAGITSNRGSARRGEYVPGSCTHRPSHHGSWLHLKAKCKTFDYGTISDWGEVVTR